jgi:lysophospholipase L1-like esterase
MTANAGRRQRRLAIVMLGLALVLLLVAVRSGSQPLGIAAAIAVAVGVAWLARTQPGEPAPRWPWVLPAGVVAAGALMVGVFLWRSWEGFGLVGAILVYLGVGSLVTKARRRLRNVWWVGPLVLVACTAAFVVGVTSLSPGVPRWAVATVALSVLTVPLGVSLLSEVVLSRLAGPSKAAATDEVPDPDEVPELDDDVRAWIEVALPSPTPEPSAITDQPPDAPASAGGPSDATPPSEQLPDATALAADPHGPRLHARWRVGLLAGGAVLALAVIAILVVDGLAFAVAATVLLVAGLLLWAIVSDNAVDTALVAVGIAVVLALIAGDAALGPQHQPAPGQPTLVAFGDSYLSGEGAQVYFEGTNQRRANECRRAPSAYVAGIVGDGDDGAAARFPHLAFLACSGARAVHLYDQPQHPDEPPGSGGLPQLANLARLQDEVGFPVPLALVSVGGNDAGFSMIGMTCLAPGNCDEVSDLWLDNLPHVRRQVRAAYQELRAGLKDDVPVVVVPYPMPLDPDGCDATWLTDAEHAFLARFVTRLNAVIQQEAARAGFWYLDDMVTSLEAEQLRLCDGSPREVGVNFIGLRSVGGTLEQVLTPTNWFHNSLHPNEAGHEAMRAAFQRWLVEHPDPGAVPDTGPARSGTDAVEQAATDEVEPPCLLTETGEQGCNAQARDWAVDRTVELLWPAGVVALAGLVGVWAFWLGVVSTWRARRPARPATVTRPRAG